MGVCAFGGAASRGPLSCYIQSISDYRWQSIVKKASGLAGLPSSGINFRAMDEVRRLRPHHVAKPNCVTLAQAKCVAFLARADRGAKPHPVRVYAICEGNVSKFPLLWIYFVRDDPLDVVRLLGERQDIGAILGDDFGSN